jgi:AcrR family transcriptional regulator
MAQQRLRPEDRRALVVEAAFAIVAEAGFEGLRTRGVAAAVKINSATLHYYFPTKKHLVAAVAERLAARLSTERAPRRAGSTIGAIAEFRQQFADVGFYQERCPDLIAVYRELAIRALRDEATRALVDQLNARWRKTLEATVRRGVDEGVFRSSIVPSATATALVAALWGAVAFLRLSRGAITRMGIELEKGLMT